MKKLTYNFIKLEIEKKGWKVLQSYYINSATPVKCSCPKGHISFKTWGNFKNGSGCTYCKGNKKLTIEFVRNKFNDEGYKLLSDVYINSEQQLNYICDKGHGNSTNWHMFKSGNRCPDCFGHNKLEYTYVNKYFKKYGYVLLDIKYKNANTKLKYSCPAGHVHNITYASFKNGNRCPTCMVTCNTGANNPSWKGGVSKLQIPLYSTYADRLGLYQEVHNVIQHINNKTYNCIGVNCHNIDCNKLFVPKLSTINDKLYASVNINKGESNLYCSEECKHSCSTYKKIKYFENQKRYYKNKRPMQSQWAKLVKERDNHICQICGKNEEIMIAHHIDPVSKNPIESADIDNGITLCKTCDKKVHQLPGCKTHELRCKK